MVPVVSTSWQSSACWRVNSVLGESGEEDAEGRVYGLVDMVISLMYCSTSPMSSGICNWYKVENRSSSTCCWMVCRVLHLWPMLDGEEVLVLEVDMGDAP